MARILILVERFYPEDFLVNSLAAEWKRRGHDVEVLTQVPSYPYDRVYDGYANRMFQTTVELDGIPVHRVRTLLGYNRSVFRKILNYLHFALATSVWAFFRGRRFDRVFIYQTAALTMATAAFPLRYVWRKPVTIWTQDLWPDAVWAFGFRRTWLRAAVLGLFVKAVYGACTRITVSCRRFVARIRETTGRDAEWIPQWEPAEMELPPKTPSGKTVFMFAGNMGVPQNLENAIAGFLAAKLDGAELWLVGDGAMAAGLREKFGDAPGVRFCGRQPRADMPQWYAKADALVISLTAQYSATLPAKFQSYIKTGRPVFGILGGETAELVAEYGLGIAADPDDVPAIASGFAKMRSMILSGEGAECGLRAKALSGGMFSKDRSVERLLG